MHFLLFVQVLFAAAVLLFGAFMTSLLDLSGVMFLAFGGLLAFIASLTSTGSRLAVILALTTDSAMAGCAAFRLSAILDLQPPQVVTDPIFAALTRPTWVDFIVPVGTLALAASAATAVALNWRALLRARWW